MLRNRDTIKKTLITVGILFIYRIGMLITLPGVNLKLFSGILHKDSFFKTLDFFFGGGIDKCSILSLSIMPYMSSSIVVQMLSSDSGIQYFQEMKQDKEMGHIKLNSWTKYITAIFAVFNALMLSSHIFHVFQEFLDPHQRR